MAKIHKFGKVKRQSTDSKMARSAAAVILLFSFSLTLIPFFVLSGIFYWILPKSTKTKFRAFITMNNHYLTELLMDFEKGGSLEKTIAED